MTQEEILRRAILNDEFPNSDEFFASDSMAQMVPDRLKFERNAALGAWMTRASGREVNASAADWQANKDALVRGFFKNPAASNVSDEQIHSLVKTHIQTAEEAADMAANMALQGKTSFEAVKEMNAKRGPSLVRGIWDGYTKDLVQRHSALSQKLTPYRGIINASASKLGKAMDWSLPATQDFQEIATQLLQVPEEDRNLVISAIGATGGATAEERASYLSKLAGAMGRMTETVASSSVDLASDVALYSFLSPLEGQEPDTVLPNYKDDEFRILTQQIRQVADAEVSPIKGDGWWSQTGIDVARMVPQVAVTVANPALGTAANLAYFRNTVAAEAKAQDPTLTYQQADAIGTLTAPFNAAIETVTSLIPFGKVKLPFLQKWLSTATTSAMGTARKFAVRGAASVGAEVGEEMAQALAPLWAQEALVALKMDMPDVDWEKRMPDFSQIAAQTWGPALVFAIVGGGAASISDIKNGRALAADREKMVASGIAPEMADKIATASEAGEWAKADELFRQEFVSPVKATLEQREEATAKIQTQSTELEDALRKAETNAMIPRVFLDSQGWAVEDLDTGARVRVGSRQEAVDLAYSGMSDKERQSADAMAQMADEFLGDRSRSEAFEISKSEQRLEDEVKAGRVTQEQVREAAQLYGQLHGLTAEESKIELLEVLGNNIAEENEGVREYVSRIHGGGNLITVIHEGVHGRWNAGLKNKHYSHDQGLMWVRMAEQASGIQFLPVSDDAAVSPAMLDEAITEIVSADVIGRRKDDKKHFSPGLISRGISAFALGEREVVLGNGKRVASGKSWVTSDGRVIEGKKWAGKFAVFLKSWKGFWGKVLRNAKALQKARKEGKIGEDFDAFLDDLLGAEPQVRYEAQAAREAADMVNDVDNAPFSLSRAKNKGQLLTFDKPIKTPLGEVISYQWQSDLIEDVDKEGEPILKRVSDWDKAATNAETGRDIVHHFTVSTPEGEKTVSLESALKATKGTDVGKSLKSAVQAARRLVVREAELVSLDAEFSKYTAEIDTLKKQAPQPEIGESDLPWIQEQGRKTVMLGDVQTDIIDPSDRYQWPLTPARLDMARSMWAEVKAKIPKPSTNRISELRALIKQDERKIKNAANIGASFSLGPRSLAAVADTVLASKMRSPEFREGFYTEARRRLANLRTDGEWKVNSRGIASRRVGFDSRMAGVRDPANIEAERKFRFRSRQRELTDAGMLALTPETLAAYDAGVMALDDSPLVSAMLNDNGKLMSKTTAQKLGKLKTDGKGNAGYYDSAPRLPAGWYGKDSGIMPDVMAQALYDQGLLKDAYPDTLWEALRSAIDSTKAANAAFDKARAAVRKVETDAAAQARKESDQWAKDETAKIPTQEERQMMALRTLDAILSAFDPKIRGIVGGFTKLAGLNTDKAREAEIERRLLKLDDVVESEARKYYAAKIEKLFKKAAPKREGGKKPTGKLGADIQGLFDLAEKFSNLDEAGVTGERSAIAEAMQKNERNADKLAELFEREQLLDVFGGIYERTAAEMESAAAWLDDTYSAGRNAWKAVIEARQEEAKQAREEAQTDIGKEGLDSEQLAAIEQSKTVTGKSKNFGLSFMSFELVMQSALGRGSAIGRSFVNKARKATNQKTDALREKRKAFRNSMASIFGTPKQSQWQLSLYGLSQITDPSAVTVTKMEGAGTKTVEIPAEIVERIIMGDADAKAYGLDALTVDALESQWNQNEALPGNRKKGNLSYDVPVAGKPTKTTISQLQAVHVTMMARQASYTENMARHGWDADVLKDIESKLTPQAKAIRDFLSNEYRAGYYPLNAVFSRMYGLNLPQLTNYAPGTFEAMDAMGQGIDPYGQGLLSEGGFKAGMLKTRQKHQAKPRLEDALAVYWGHVNATEHFKAFGEFARDIRSVLNFAEVRGSITAKGGESLLEAVQNWITAFERNGVENRGTSSAFNEFIRKRQSSQAYIALAYNVGTLWKQSTASFAAMLDMGPMDAMRVFAKFLSGQLELSESYRSDVIQRRLDAGYSPEVRQAMAGMMAEKPSWASPFVQKGMEIIGLVDAMFTTASHAMAYDHHLTQAKAAGLNDAQAKLFATREAEATVARTAQPSEMMDRSLNEIGMQPLAKFMFMFATEARQKAALAWDAYSLNSGLTKGERATRLLLLHVIFPVIIQTITNAWRDARDDGEDDEIFDEKNWQAADYARAMIFGPLLGVPLVGNALNSFSSQSPWSQFSGGILGVMKAIEDDDLEGGLKAAKTVIRTAAIVAGGEKAAAAGISAGVLFDAYRVIGNVAED